MKTLSNLLDQPEHMVRKIIGKLEDKNGYPSHDVRQLADNVQKVRLKIADLKLDPADTTAQELYHALQVKFEADSRNFDAEHQLSSASFEIKAAAAIQLIAANIELPELWVLKSSAAKNLLRAHVPRKLMKRLNYRSLDSMLKRENICEVYAALSFIESESWHKELNRLVSKLDSTAFERKTLSLSYLSEAKWGRPGEMVVIHSDQTGSLALAETELQSAAPLLSIAALLIDSLSSFKELNLSNEVARLSPALAWWSDMDGLICSLNGQHISMNLKDLSHNHSFDERILDNSRRSLWHQLIARYDNQLEIQEDMALELKDNLIKITTPINQPAFEYVEDF